MRILCAWILLAIVCISVVASTQVKYFPAGALYPDPEGSDWWTKWLSEEFTRLKEPSLFHPASGARTESYRFLWVRSSHPDVSVRIDVKSDGSSSVTTKITGGKPGPRKLKSSHVTEVTKEQTSLFLATLERNNFWNLSTSDRYRGFDGTDWLIEGTKGGTYHLVFRWTPKDENVRAIGFAMLNDLANLNISHKAD